MLVLVSIVLIVMVRDVIGQTTATAVYGQGGSFTTSTSGTSTATFNTPIGISLDASENMYVVDTLNNRVVFFAKGSTTASRVYGQLGSFTSSTVNNGGVSADSLNQPVDVAIDSTNGVYIADQQNNRVLFYAAGSTTAARVYGQLGSFTTNTLRNGGITATSLYRPNAVALDSSGNLYVSDSGNNRVLFFLAGSTTATRVYGQGGMFNTWAFTPITADSLSVPTDVKLDSSGNVYIVDGGNNRVLFYLSGSTTATRVYGQLGLFNTPTINNGGVSADSLGQPSGVIVGSGNEVYIVDKGNCRVLRYSASGTTANQVFGQAGSFSSVTTNNGGVSANSFSLPYRIARGQTSGDLYISDGGNNRVLVYAANSATTSGSSTTAPSGGSSTCFHESTVISYKDQDWTLEQLFRVDDGHSKPCHVPHVVKAVGVVVYATCSGERTERKLRLTFDHLVFTRSGLKQASDLIPNHDVLFADLGQTKECRVSKVVPEASEQTYFGLNCHESVVLANGIKTSTFGRYHTVPAAWMKWAGWLLGVDRASRWGDSIVEFLAKIKLV